jgi:twitching motility protein PilT
MAQIDQLLEFTRKVGGSDLHLAVGSPPLVRVHGQLKPASKKALTPQETLHLIGEILSEQQRRSFGEKNDLDLSYEVAGIGRFRVNVLRQRKGVDACFRAIPEHVPAPEELGIPAAVLKLTTLRKGLVLVTGPSGCGKSTTLAALVQRINETRAEHVITIEDPVEFVYPRKRAVINQRSVGKNTASFARALRAALREDPDVILVGEMRDLETISLAITAAETGHLVFATLNTASAHKTVERIIGSFPSGQQSQIRAMLSDSLRGVVTQMLLPRADGAGRVACFEVLIGNTPVANLIREGRTFQIPSIMQTGTTLGMCLMDQSLAELLKKGRISPEVAWIRARDQKALRALMPAGFREAPAAAAPSPAAAAARGR